MTLGTTSITRKGQLTVPQQVRNLLGLSRGDKVTFVEDNGKIVVRRDTSIVARTAGSVRTPVKDHTAEELREVTEIEIAEEAIFRSS